MKRRQISSASRAALLLTFAALSLLCVSAVGAASPLQTGPGAAGGEPQSVAASSEGPGISHLPPLVEAPEAGESLPVGAEHLNALILGFFLVSLGMLVGASLAGRHTGRRLEMSRLPAVVPLAPARAPLSALEVFRL